MFSSIVKSHNTYALATERASLLVQDHIRDRFLDRNSPERILNSHLILDASNKKGKGCVGKIVLIVGLDGIVKQFALKLDYTVSKKAENSAKLTSQSLEEQLGDGIAFIMGITTDAFGAAKDEAIKVLQYIDGRAVEISLTKPELLRRHSVVILGQTYDYNGKFRVLVHLTCQMHNYERVLSPILSIFMGNQGLKYDMTTSQNLYRIQYYWTKFKSFFDTLTVISQVMHLME